MSGCMDVCIYQDADATSEMCVVKIVTARKPHRCCECRGAIAAGQQYERATGKCDGYFFADATCLLCVEIRKAFVCGNWVMGDLWDSIEWELFPRWRTEGPFECLAKLETTAARELCQRMFADWEADHDA